MKKLDRNIARRKEIVERYNKAFANHLSIVIPYQQEGCNNSWHLYVIQVPNRKEVFDKLRAAGIGVNVHYVPVYQFPYYQNHGYEGVHCPNAEAIYERMISIPIYATLLPEEQEYVIERILQIVAE
jgi:dTDP-4-amino-4,6-dideoxygalactose transaminase